MKQLFLKKIASFQDQDNSTPMSLPLGEVNGATMQLVLEWLKLHNDDPVWVRRGYNEEIVVSQKDKDFMKVGS